MQPIQAFLTPHYGSEASKHQEGSRESTCPIRIHIVGCNSVVTLFGFGGEGDDYAQLH